jgi:YVTN family beta-propeller protein
MFRSVKASPAWPLLCLLAALVWASPFAYIPNNTSSNVSVIDLDTNTVVNTITAGSDSYGVSASADGKTVYVTNRVGNTVSVIDTATNTVSATIAVGTKPYGASVSPDSKKVYVANCNDNTISAIYEA